METLSLKSSEKERKKIISLDHIGTWQTYRHYEEQFTCEFSKRFAEKQTIRRYARYWGPFCVKSLAVQFCAILSVIRKFKFLQIWYQLKEKISEKIFI